MNTNMAAKDCPSHSATATSSLVEVFNEFKYWKSTLGQAFKETVPHFDQIVKLSTPNSKDKIKAALLQYRKPLEDFLREDNVPNVLVLGQNNSGKTSFINELLEYQLLPTSDSTTASRVVKIKYNEELYIKKIDANNKTHEKFNLEQRATVSSEYIMIPKEELSSSKHPTESVEIGLPHPLLKSGVVLFDVPCFAKQRIVDMVQRECIDSVMPLLLYVVDGNYGFRLRDQDLLSTLYKLSPQLEIIYICNKIDVDIQAVEMDQASDESDEENDDGGSSMDKKRRTYHSLVKFGFLGAKGKAEAKPFFGISVRELRRDRTKQLKDSNNTTEFERLMKSFSALANKLLKKHTVRFVRLLHSAQVRCCKSILVPSLQRQSEKPEGMESKAKFDSDTLVKKVEMIDRLINDLTDKMTISIAKAIETITPDVIKTVREMEYSPIEIGDVVRRDEMTLQLADQVRSVVAMKVTQHIKYHLINKFRIKELYDKIAKIMDDLDVAGLQTFTMEIDFTSLQEEIRWGISKRVMTLNIQHIYKKVRHYFSTVTVDAKWREGIAKEVLNHVTPQMVTQIVCDEIRLKVQEYAEEIRTFIRCLDDLAGFKTNSQDADISQIVPVICRSLCRTDALLDYVKREKVKLNRKTHLFKSGERTDVYIRDGTNTFLRVKKQREPNDNTAEVLIALVRVLTLPVQANILQATALVTVEIHNNDNTMSLSSACEVPQKYSDLWTELKDRDISLSTDERLAFGLEIAVTCKTLSLSGLAVQDLRVTNILIEQRCSDHGTKWRAVVNTLKPRNDSIPYPDNIPPFHIPPEDYTDANQQCDNMCYRSENNCSTVYAFGVLLWLLLVGKIVQLPHPQRGKGPKEDEHAETIKIVRAEIQNFKANISEKYEKLIVKCLSYDKSERPSWDDIIQDLTRSSCKPHVNPSPQKGLP